METSHAEESGELEDMSDDGSDTDWVQVQSLNTRRRTTNLRACLVRLIVWLPGLMLVCVVSMQLFKD